MSAVGALLRPLTDPQDVVLPLVVVGVALVVTLLLIWYLSLDL